MEGHLCDLSLSEVNKPKHQKNGRVTMESEKLNLNKDFRRLYGRGKNFVHPLLVTYIMQNRRGVVRYGITTGKKVGGAVERNRARRVIEAAAREAFKGMDCGGVDIVFVARSRTVTAKSYVVASVMKKHLSEGGICPSKQQ